MTLHKSNEIILTSDGGYRYRVFIDCDDNLNIEYQEWVGGDSVYRPHGRPFTCPPDEARCIAQVILDLTRDTVSPPANEAPPECPPVKLPSGNTLYKALLARSEQINRGEYPHDC